VWFDDLGFDAASDPAVTHLITDSRALWPQRRHDQHKGSFGDVWVVGGAPGMRGAVWLAARAALAAGAGRVMVVALGTADHAGFDASHPELMLRDSRVLQVTPSPIEHATVVCGCGGGEAVRELLPGLIAHAGALVLDADAINALAADRAMAEGLTRRAARGRPTLMTPHPLEAARWLRCHTASVQADRLKVTRTLAAQARSGVVLKGSGSVIAEPGGSAWINGSGNAALATAGTGDVLAGWIGGLWSQGLDPISAMKLGVHTHGLAADRWAVSQAIDGPLCASLLIEQLRALRQLTP
jgi:ADP-dependent NAD(P)H-hydrate dehydratase / NAD(P)H-hydrate epimerase